MTTTARGYAFGHLRHVTFCPDIQRYMELIEGTFEPHGGRWLVHGVTPDVREGNLGDLVIIEFPSLRAARAWYDSPGYQELVPLRAEHSESHVALLEGVPDGYRAEQTVAALVRSAV